MARTSRALLLLPVVLGLLVAGAMLTQGAAAPAAHHAAASAKAKGKKPKKPKPPYVVKEGPIFNNATGPYRDKAKIQTQILGAINHAHKGSTIHIATWSFFSGPATNALINAHKRGVSVRFVMARGKSKHNPSFRRLKAALSKGNAKRPKELRSAVRTCRATCRGTHGTMHSKIYLFSWTGKSRNVVMWGSANLTSAAVRIQWNDMFTSTRTALYDYVQQIYGQLWADKPHVGKYEIHQFGNIGFATLPAWKRDNTDWVTDQLRQVKCTGATNVPGGHTTIQIAQAITYGPIGDRIARHLRTLKSQGCSVSFIYTRLGKSTSRILGNIPKKHYVQDTNGDGFFDRYLHMKVMAIKGYIGTNRGATLVMNGSENWGPTSLGNDETVGYFTAPWIWNRYHKQLNWLWTHVPRSASYRGYRLGAPPANPYAHLELD